MSTIPLNLIRDGEFVNKQSLSALQSFLGFI